MRTFHRTLSAEVSNTLFSNNDIDVVLAVVFMRYHRNDGADFSFFGNGWTSKDGNISIAGEVARTTDTVHHLGSTDMGRVYIAVNVCFDGSINRDNTETADYFRII